MGCSLLGSFCPWDFPGKNTGVGGHFLLQGIFLTQELNLCLLLLHCRQILYHRATREVPYITEDVHLTKISVSPCRQGTRGSTYEIGYTLQQIVLSGSWWLTFWMENLELLLCLYSLERDHNCWDHLNHTWLYMLPGFALSCFTFTHLSDISFRAEVGRGIEAHILPFLDAFVLKTTLFTW